jgi:cytochrome P450
VHGAGPKFDLTALPSGFYADPYPHYAELREHAPVYQCPDGTWLLTRHADLERIYRDRSNFSSDKRAAFAPKYGVESPLYAHHTTSLVFNGRPVSHARASPDRRCSDAARAQGARARGRGTRRSAARCARGARPRRPRDRLRRRHPVEVIGGLLGVPRDERAPLRNWSLAILGALEPVLSPEQQAFGERSVREFLDYLAKLVADRRRIPGGDDRSTDAPDPR